VEKSSCSQVFPTTEVTDDSRQGHVRVRVFFSVSKAPWSSNQSKLENDEKYKMEETRVFEGKE